VSVPPDSVRDAIEAGDVERVRDLIIAATEKERREIRKVVDGMGHYAYGSPMHLARNLAWMGTATARQIASEWWMPLNDARERRLTYEVLAARGASFIETVARNTIEDGVQRMWPVLHLAVADGLIDGPEDSDSYVRGMAWGLGWAGTDADATYHALLADGELLEGDVWQIFEVDCSTELSNANVWETGEHGALVAGGKRDNRWQWALVRLADEGRLDRERLLDASLGALLRDFRPSMVGWYAHLHEALEPCRDERLQRIDTYLSLLSSPTPAAIKQGLTGLRAVDESVPADDLARAAAGPLSQKQKNLAVDMLRLLEGKAKQEPDARIELLDAAALALGHARTDVQERALALLERYPGEAPRSSLLGLVHTVSAQLRPRVQALTGISEQPEPPSLLAQPIAPPVTSDPRALVPVESVDELIELAAFLLEGQGNGDDVERLLDGVSRLCDQRPQGFKRRSAGLRKTVEDLGWWEFGSTANDAVRAVVGAWVNRRRTRGLKPRATLLGLLAERALEVAARAARGSARPLLAFPTHEGGRIDPDVLAERERGFGRVLNRPAPADQLHARIRALRTVEPIGYMRRIVDSPRWGSAERQVELLPERLPQDLVPIADRVRRVGSFSGSIWVDTPPWGSWDGLGTRWCLTAVPSHPEIAFAGAAVLIAQSLDASPQLHPEPVLEHALDPGIPLGETAWLAIGGALLAQSPDLRRLGTDVLVASIADGRFDPDALGGAIAWLVDGGLAKASRLDASLRDAGRISSPHAAQVLRLVEALVASLQATPHGLHAVLEVALECATSAGLAVEREDARAALERITREVSAGSKVGRLARGLLEAAGSAT
jgi:hypothetical protein